MFMQKNWFVIYTRPQCEKKVAALLAKKKIENFVPLVSLEKQKVRKNKIVTKPLFASYVFVNVTDMQLQLLRHTEGVINFLYWLGKPAVIAEAEVSAIKEFTADYRDIELERLSVNSNLLEKNVYRSSYEIEGNLVAIKNKTIKINLPSLGYAMIANLKEESVFGLDKSMSQNYTFAQS
jgi:transcription antitermination factor NusG